MAIPCKELKKALVNYKDLNERGAISELSRQTGVSQSVLSRLSTGSQDTIELTSWEKLHNYDPTKFPPPNLPDQAKTTKGQFSKKALSKYPFVNIIIEHANESAEENFSKETVIQLFINSLNNELIKEKKEVPRKYEKAS